MMIFHMYLQLQIWRHVGCIYVKFQEVNPQKIYSRISPRSFQASSHKLRRDSLCLCRAKRSWEMFFFRLVKFRFRPVCFFFSARRKGLNEKDTTKHHRNLRDTLEKSGWNENLLRWTTIQNLYNFHSVVSNMKTTCWKAWQYWLLLSSLAPFLHTSPFKCGKRSPGKKRISTRKIVLLDKLLGSEAACHDFFNGKIVVILS